jgi:hypothetical protein
MALDVGSGGGTSRRKPRRSSPPVPKKKPNLDDVEDPWINEQIERRMQLPNEKLRRVFEDLGLVDRRTEQGWANASVIEDEMDDYRDYRGGMPDIGRAMEELARQLGLEPLPETRPDPGTSLMQGTIPYPDYPGSVDERSYWDRMNEEGAQDLHGLPLDETTRQWGNREIHENWPSMNFGYYKPTGLGNPSGMLAPGEEDMGWMQELNQLNPVHWIQQALEEGEQPSAGPEWGAAGGLSLLDLLPVLLRSGI